MNEPTSEGRETNAAAARDDEPSSEVSVPKTTARPSDTGAGEAANEASKLRVSESVTHGGTGGHGQGEPVARATDIPDPAPMQSDEAAEGSGTVPLPDRAAVVAKRGFSAATEDPSRGVPKNTVKTQANIEGVDVQAPPGAADTSLMRASPNAKSERQQATAKTRNHQAFSSEPADDANARDPNARADMETEIAHPGSHGGAGSPGRTPG